MRFAKRHLLLLVGGFVLCGSAGAWLIWRNQPPSVNQSVVSGPPTSSAPMPVPAYSDDPVIPPLIVRDTVRDPACGAHIGLKPLATLGWQHDTDVKCLAFSPDGKLLATCAGKNIKILNLATGKNIANLNGHHAAVLGLAFNFDGTKLASTDGSQIRLWTIANGQESVLPEAIGIDAIACSPRGQWMATGQQNGTVKIWDLTTLKEIATLAGNEPVIGLAFSGDGRTLVAAVSKGNTRLWKVDLPRKPTTATLMDTGWTWSIALNAPGTMFAKSYGSNIECWDTTSKKRLAEFAEPNETIVSLCFSPDGKTLASASDGKCIRLWEAATGKNLATLEGHEGAVRSVAFSPDGKTLASGSEDMSVRLWDVDTRRNSETYFGNGGRITDILIDRNNRTLAGASTDGSVMLWDIASERCTHRIVLEDASGYSSVALSPNGRTLAAAGGETVAVWDVPNRKRKWSVKPATRVDRVQFSPDGQTFCGWGDGLFLWQGNTPKPISRQNKNYSKRLSSFAFSPDSAGLAYSEHWGSWRQRQFFIDVLLWDAQKKETLLTIEVPGSDYWIGHVTYHPSGQTLATAGKGGNVQFWDLPSGLNTMALNCHYLAIPKMTFSPDGETMAVVGVYEPARKVKKNSIRMVDIASATISVDVEVPIKAWDFVLKFSPNGKVLAFSAGKGFVELWEVVAQGKER